MERFQLTSQRRGCQYGDRDEDKGQSGYERHAGHPLHERRLNLQGFATKAWNDLCKDGCNHQKECGEGAASEKHIIKHSRHIANCQIKMLPQSNRNMPNRLFLFHPWTYSIRTIPSMIQPRKNSERNAKEEKETRAEIVNAYPLVLHVSYWSTLFNASLLKIAIKHIETLCFLHYFR